MFKVGDRIINIREGGRYEGYKGTVSLVKEMRLVICYDKLDSRVPYDLSDAPDYLVLLEEAITTTDSIRDI